MKKIILLIFLLFSFVSCGREKYFLPLGNLSTNLVNEITNIARVNYKDYFTSEKMTSSELFKIVDSNASFLFENKKYSFLSVLNKASHVVISLGLEDIYPSITIDEKRNAIKYDDSLIAKQLEILDYNLVHILEVINDAIKPSNILVIGTYANTKLKGPELLLYKGLIAKINKVLMLASSDNQAKYISLVALEEDSKNENFASNKDKLEANIISSYL